MAQNRFKMRIAVNCYLKLKLSTKPFNNSIPRLRNTATLSQRAIELLDTIPGVARKAAEIIVCEIGTDMSHFKSAAHLAAWALACTW